MKLEADDDAGTNRDNMRAWSDGVLNGDVPANAHEARIAADLAALLDWGDTLTARLVEAEHSLAEMRATAEALVTHIRDTDDLNSTDTLDKALRLRQALAGTHSEEER